MKVYYYLPPVLPDSPPLMVLHGLKRDADVYFNTLMKSGEPERLGITLVVPSFSAKLFPKAAGYNFGNVFEEDPDVEGAKLSLRPTSEWAFTALERCFDELCKRAGHSPERGYNLFGHSAGAQFSHRFLLLAGAGQLRVKCCVCANAGWYTMPHVPAQHRFPYGLRHLPADLLGTGAAGSAGEDVERALAAAFVKAPLLLLLGDQDTDPQKPRPEIWRATPEANAQGKHRFERGHSFFNAGQAMAEHLGVPFGWQLQVVPGVGHHGGAMAALAAGMLYDKEASGKLDLSILERVPAEDMA